MWPFFKFFVKFYQLFLYIFSKYRSRWFLLDLDFIILKFLLWNLFWNSSDFPQTFSKFNVEFPKNFFNISPIFFSEFRNFFRFFFTYEVRWRDHSFVISFVPIKILLPFLLFLNNILINQKISQKFCKILRIFMQNFDILQWLLDLKYVIVSTRIVLLNTISTLLGIHQLRTK